MRSTTRPSLFVKEVGDIRQNQHQLHYTLYRPTSQRLGQVLLAGPFGPVAGQTQAFLDRWARFLASNDLEVATFDYRGTGLSTGDFSQMDCMTWLNDITTCESWMRDRGYGCPLVLHGFELGALLATRAFNRGLGDALLSWSAPATTRDVLDNALRLEAIAQHDQVDPSDFIRNSTDLLEVGTPAMVGNHQWSPRLWRQSAEFILEDPDLGSFARGGRKNRAWKTVELNPTVARKRPWVANSDAGQTTAELKKLFQSNFTWIRRNMRGGVWNELRHQADHLKSMAMRWLAPISPYAAPTKAVN